MMHERGPVLKTLAPHLSTLTGPPTSRAASRLPDDIVNEQVRRLTLFSIVSWALWTISLLMDAVVTPALLPASATHATRATLVAEAVAVVVSAAIVVYARFSPGAPRTKTDAGLWLMILNAADIALLETWAQTPSVDTLGRLSWIPIVILISAMIMPGKPRRMLAATLVSASTLPIGIWFAHLRGIDVPGPLTTLVMCLPNYVCAVVAVLPSQMFQTMGRRLREARELGNYQLVERLGQGGMGEVWRARHRLLARPAAIKLVRPEMLASPQADAPQALRRFEREAQATATLSSPHSIRLFDFGATDDGSFYYVMELLEGRDLESLVREFGPLPEARVLYLLAQVCASLEEAHAIGLVHRDVKPANIFACRMGLEYDFVKVLDFGLVQNAPAVAGEDVTQSLATVGPAVLGTPAYLAPEAILGRSVDARADIYALGCVACFLLTGERVFKAETAMQSLIDHVHTPPVAPSHRTTRPISPGVDELVLACLEKDPDRRPQTAGALARLIAARRRPDAWSNAHAKDWWLAVPARVTVPAESFERRLP